MEALGACQMSQALYSERITAAALSLFPINSLRNQVTGVAQARLGLHWRFAEAWSECVCVMAALPVDAHKKHAAHHIQALLMASGELLFVSNADMLIGSDFVTALQDDAEWVSIVPTLLCQNTPCQQLLA